MSKLLPATCEDGVVTAEGVEVPAAEILSEGVAASSGFLILDGDKAYYVAKTSPDLVTTLEKIAEALDEVGAALAAIDAKPTGGSGSAPAPAAAGNVTALATLAGELEDLKDALK